MTCCFTKYKSFSSPTQCYVSFSIKFYFFKLESKSFVPQITLLALVGKTSFGTLWFVSCQAMENIPSITNYGSYHAIFAQHINKASIILNRQSIYIYGQTVYLVTIIHVFACAIRVVKCTNSFLKRDIKFTYTQSFTSVLITISRTLSA